MGIETGQSHKYWNTMKVWTTFNSRISFGFRTFATEVVQDNFIVAFLVCVNNRFVVQLFYITYKNIHIFVYDFGPKCIAKSKFILLHNEFILGNFALSYIGFSQWWKCISLCFAEYFVIEFKTESFIDPFVQVL